MATFVGELHIGGPREAVLSGQGGCAVTDEKNASIHLAEGRSLGGD